MKLASYWHDTATPFTGAAPTEVGGDVDVAVIGGGFTGLNAARKLAKSGVRVAVLEARHVGFGASGRNGGHMNSGLAYSYGGAAKLLGEDKARSLWHAVDASIDMVEQIVEEERIDCSFRRAGKLKLAAKPTHEAKIRAMGEEIRRNVDPTVRWMDRDELAQEINSPALHGAIVYPKSGMAHMGNYVTGLAEAAVRHGATIWHDAPVTGRKQIMNGWELTTPRGSLRARQVILATDAYTTANFGWFRRRLIPIASFLIATRPLSDAEVRSTVPGNRTFVNSLNISNYFRLTPDNRLLFGGRARFSAVSNDRSDAVSGELLRKQMLRFFPQLADVAIDYCWGGLVGCTQDRLPRAGRADGVIYAAGYSGHGAQFSTLMGNALADIAMGIEGTNPLEGTTWKAVPLHTGKPWFMPIVGSYYRIKDALP